MRFSNWFIKTFGTNHDNEMKQIRENIDWITERIQLIKSLCQRALMRKYYYLDPDHGDNYTIGVNEGIRMVLDALNGDVSGLEKIIEEQVDYDVKEERKLERALKEIVDV